MSLGKKDVKRIAVMFILWLSCSSLWSAEKADTLKDQSFIKRISIHTNAFNWFLTVPNLGIEYDFQNSSENRFSVLLQGSYNGNTSHTIQPRYVFNLANASLEFRKYWRTGGTVGSTFSKYQTRDTTISRFSWFFKKMRRNVFSGRTVTNPRDWRAYYVGLYVGYDQYSLAAFGKGVQGESINLGISGGWSVPLYILRDGRSLDLDLGLTVGAKATQFDRYKYISETGCYEYSGRRDFHVVPYPVIHELRIGLAYRFRSIANKVQGGAERYNQWDDLQKTLKAQRQIRMDSIQQVRIKERAEKEALKKEKEKEKELKKKEAEEKKKAKESEKARKKEEKNEEKKEDKVKKEKEDPSESKKNEEEKGKKRKKRKKEDPEKLEAYLLDRASLHYKSESFRPV